MDSRLYVKTSQYLKKKMIWLIEGLEKCFLPRIKDKNSLTTEENTDYLHKYFIH